MKNYRAKTCLVCGKEYQPVSPTQKYCSECGPAAKADVHKVCDARWNKKANPEEGRARVAKWAKENPEKATARVIKWRMVNSERNRAEIAKWKKANPDKVAVSFSKRRAAKYANTPISEMLTSTEWLAILAEVNGHCAYCDKEAKLTLDHVIPLSKGGKHSKDNVVAACAHCNSSKGDRTLEEWKSVTRSQLETARG